MVVMVGAVWDWRSARARARAVLPETAEMKMYKLLLLPLHNIMHNLPHKVRGIGACRLWGSSEMQMQLTILEVALTLAGLGVDSYLRLGEGEGAKRGGGALAGS